MKTVNKILIVFIYTFAALSNVTIAQSDYEKTEKFKERYQQLENDIRNADSLAECNSIEFKIDSLVNDFRQDKKLLDAALYPDNFTSSILKLKTQLETRKSDFTQIVELQTQVVELENQIDNLNRRNTALINEIGTLKNSRKKDSETIASLNRLVSTLRSSIRERDELVKDIIDSLFQEYVNKPLTLNDAEKNAFYGKIESGNLFYNVQRTINDNIQLLNVTEFEPDDLESLKEKQVDFKKVWTQLGTKIAKVYSEDKKGLNDVSHINDLFLKWEARVNQKIWESVDKKFQNNGIKLSSFKDGEQFKSVVTTFIDDEIKYSELRDIKDSQKSYSFFVDSTWFKTIKPDYLPILTDYNLLTSAQKDTIENRISKWNAVVEPSAISEIYYYAAGIVIIILLLVGFKKMRKKPQS